MQSLRFDASNVRTALDWHHTSTWRLMVGTWCFGGPWKVRGPCFGCPSSKSSLEAQRSRGRSSGGCPCEPARIPFFSACTCSKPPGDRLGALTSFRHIGRLSVTVLGLGIRKSPPNRGPEISRSCPACISSSRLEVAPAHHQSNPVNHIPNTRILTMVLLPMLDS